MHSQASIWPTIFTWLIVESTYIYMNGNGASQSINSGDIPASDSENVMFLSDTLVTSHNKFIYCEGPSVILNVMTAW